MSYTQLKVFKTNKYDEEIEEEVNNFLSRPEFKNNTWRCLGTPTNTCADDEFFYKEINVYYEIKDNNQPVQTQETCPTCGKALAVKTYNGRSFIGCTGFPTCRYTKNV